VIDLARRLVTKDGVAVKLTPKEYDLLAHLARGEGRLLTHRQLLTAVWGPRIATTPNICESSLDSFAQRSRRIPQTLA